MGALSNSFIADVGTGDGFSHNLGREHHFAG